MTGRRDRNAFLRIPLAEQLFENNRHILMPRSIDNRWYYHGVCPIVMAGFNPFLGSVMVPVHSALNTWIGDPNADIRALNFEDRLVREVLFAVHDFIHVWTWKQIEELRPELRISSPAFPVHRVEEYAFALLVTEAAATVGLDYWYLSTMELNELLDIGTTLTTLTTSYHEKHAAEYRKFHEGLSVQREEFFEELLQFYCTGRFQGFSLDDIQRSPLLAKWLFHELKYGKVQRTGARRWFRYLAGVPERSNKDDDAPVSASLPWQVELVREIGARLWTLVKGAGTANILGDTDEIWKPPSRKVKDFRYRNIQCCHRSDWSGDLVSRLSKPSKRFLCYQLVSSRTFPKKNDDARDITVLLKTMEVDRLEDAVCEMTFLSCESEPRDMIFAN